ncbi:MAG: inositol monophosphatase family protein [Polyangiaceae bacterium]
MTSELRTLLEAAIDCGRRMGAKALEHYVAHRDTRSLAVEFKGDGSPVSNADRDAELVARAFISEYFPGDGVLGEELGELNPGAKRRWCLDPIDGTKSFLGGAPLWGSLVAVCEGEEVLAGVAVFPATRELIAAAPGQGCIVEGGIAEVSTVDRVDLATVLTTDDRFKEAPACEAPWRKLAHASRIARTWGDCYGYYLVATGRAEVMSDGILSPWDAACLQPIIEEAGGVFTDWEGKRTWFGRGVLATNRALARTAREILGVPVSA